MSLSADDVQEHLVAGIHRRPCVEPPTVCRVSDARIETPKAQDVAHLFMGCDFNSVHQFVSENRNRSIRGQCGSQRDPEVAPARRRRGKLQPPVDTARHMDRALDMDDHVGLLQAFQKRSKQLRALASNLQRMTRCGVHRPHALDAIL